YDGWMDMQQAAVAMYIGNFVYDIIDISFSFYFYFILYDMNMCYPHVSLSQQYVFMHQE
ncbi:hypothetical protein ACJX0J_030483, partial [Zea mays]